MASASFRVLLLIVVIGLLVGGGDAWGRRRRRCPSPSQALSGAQTNWDATFQIGCPANMVIRHIRSAHCNTAEDRVWRFGCGAVRGVSRFDGEFWSGWINDYDGDMNYHCPFNGLITGFRSQHDNGREDRRWKVMCSRKNNMVTSDCYLTNYANTWDGVMDFTVPNGYYLRGMHGYHSNSREDRLYKFFVCKVRL